MKTLFWIGLAALCGGTTFCYLYTGELLFNYIFNNGWLLCLVIAIIYPFFQAWREALYFSLKATNTKFDDTNEHPYFAIERGLVFILIGCLLQSWSVFYLAFLFPFLHDGYYYYVRNQVDGIYPKTWMEHPTEIKALTDYIFYPWVRVGMFIISLVVYLCIYI